MQPTWVAKRGWRFAVMRGVLPRTSPAHYDFHHFLLSRPRSGLLALQGPAALGGEPGSAAPTANRKPEMAVVSHCSPAAPRRALFNVTAPFRSAALAMGRPCPAVNTGRAPMQPTWQAKRGWRLAVLWGVQPPTSLAHYDSHQFFAVAASFRPAGLARGGPPSAVSLEAPRPTANRKPGMAEGSIAAR
jgi:hypothetical protein